MQSEPSILMTIFGGPDTEPIRRVSTERLMTRWASVSPVCQITLAKRAKSWIQSRSGWGPTGTQGACRSASGVPPSGDWVPIVCARWRRLDPAGSTNPRIDPCCMTSISPRRTRGFPCLRRQGGYGDTVSLDAWKLSWRASSTQAPRAGRAGLVFSRRSRGFR
jgi:hypothetical protein